MEFFVKYVCTSYILLFLTTTVRSAEAAPRQWILVPIPFVKVFGHQAIFDILDRPNVLSRASQANNICRPDHGSEHAGHLLLCSARIPHPENQRGRCDAGKFLGVP